jgi:hypothetical protein
VTVIAYKPEGDAVVVLKIPVAELMDIPVGGVPPSVQVNVPLMPDALGAVACVNAVPEVDCSNEPGVTAIVGQTGVSV